MNEALQMALAKILQSSIDAVSAGVSFLQAEVPEVIQQLLMFHLIRFSVLALVSLSALCIAVWVLWKVATAKEVGIWREKPHETSPLEPTALSIFGAGLALVAAPMAVVGFVSAALTVTKIAIAPKLYLIEYAASLVR